MKNVIEFMKKTRATMRHNHEMHSKMICETFQNVSDQPMRNK